MSLIPEFELGVWNDSTPNTHKLGVIVWLINL
jgi:hypothetical protein